jgi:UDP-GlcNAc:undecaprenyl-phosphate GlcNAc-1-phosphate transferase
MKLLLAVFLATTLVSAILTPVVRLLALRLGAVSTPGGRHVHRQVTPRLGGVAIFLAVLAALIPLALGTSVETVEARAEPMRLLGLFGGGTLMCLVGAWDDIRGLRARHKLYAQIVVALGAYACGFRLDVLFIPLLGTLSLGPLALPATVLWIVGIVNAINLIDGLDGLAGGVVFFAGLTSLIVAVLSGAPFVAFVMAAVLGAVLGFLFYNFNPALIFMGDSGSYFLGYVLSVTFLAGSQKASSAVSLLVPMLALGVPIFDTLFSMVRRVIERRPVFSPDRGHLHHRLLDMGLTHRRAVMTLYAVCAAFTVSALAVSIGRSWQVGFALVASSAVLFGLVRFVGYFEWINQRVRQRQRLSTLEEVALRSLVAELPEVLRGASDTDALLARFVTRAQDAGIVALSILACGAPPSATKYDWRARTNSSAPPAQRTFWKWRRARTPYVTVTRFELRAGNLHADLRISLLVATNRGVSPQVDAMLQVVADRLALELARCESPLLDIVPEVAGELAESTQKQARSGQEAKGVAARVSVAG